MANILTCAGTVHMVSASIIKKLMSESSWVNMAHLRWKEEKKERKRKREKEGRIRDYNVENLVQDTVLPVGTIR